MLRESIEDSKQSSKVAITEKGAISNEHLELWPRNVHDEEMPKGDAEEHTAQRATLMGAFLGQDAVSVTPSDEVKN